MRTIPGVEDLFQPLEQVIRLQFLLALTGRLALSDTERELIALPACLGGLGIPKPSCSARLQQEACAEVTAPLVDLINVRAGKYPKSVQQDQRQVKSTIRSRHQELIAKKAEDVKGRITGGQRNGVEQASERGASIWLTAIPLAKYGFGLNKQVFRDAICLRYG